MKKAEKQWTEETMRILCRDVLNSCSDAVGTDDSEIVVNFAATLTELCARMIWAMEADANLLISLTFGSDKPYNENREDPQGEDFPF